MRVAVACDHGGFPHKMVVLDVIRQAGHEDYWPRFGSGVGPGFP